MEAGLMVVVIWALALKCYVW